MAVAHVNGSDAFQNDVVKSGVPVLVDFYADWCGPCKLAEPIMEKLSEEYVGKASVVKIDVDQPDNRAIAAEHGVMSIPTVVLYVDGKVVAKQIGFIGEDGYRQLLAQGMESTGKAE